MSVFKADGSGRMQTHELVEQIRRACDVELVEGFAKALDETHALRNADRVISFREVRGTAWHVTHEGERWMEWETAPLPAKTHAMDAVFIFTMAFGHGSPLTQPTGHFDLYINEEKALSFRVVKHAERWRSEKASLWYTPKWVSSSPEGGSFTLDSVIVNESMASFGVGMLKVPMARLTPGKPVRLKVVARNRNVSRHWFKLDGVRDNIALTDFFPALTSVTQKEKPTEIGGYRLLFGDIHTHSGHGAKGPGKGCGTGTVDENFEYARDVANLDFYALSEHDVDIWNDEGWAMRRERTDHYNAPGRFVTIPAFEWTSSLHGHRNVYTLRSDLPFFTARKGGDQWTPENDTPRDLWKKLRDLRAKAITVPHHPTAVTHPFNWDYFDPEFDRLAEIYSSWGNSEYPHNPHLGRGADRWKDLYVQAALARGYRFGIIASSDGHDGNPGFAQGIPKHPHLYHDLGSGRVAVLAKDYTREGIFEALHARRCYGTTGERIALDFRINGLFMGAEIETDDDHLQRKIEVRVTGTCPLRDIVVVKNNVDTLCHRASHDREAITCDDDAFIKKTDWYYVRATQADGEMAWSSPIWVTVKAKKGAKR